MKKLLKKKNNKIGILGGTFDPPHYGHVKISKTAIKKLGLKKVFWTITNQNPFKSKPNFNLKKRIILCKKILRNQKKIKIKNLNKKQYSLNTYNLLSCWKNKNKKNKIFFLMGADNLINFHKWYKWKKITQLAKIIIFARPGFSKKTLVCVALKTMDKQDWIYIKSTKLNISSTKLKKI